MSVDDRAGTTDTIQVHRLVGSRPDPTPGLVLVYSRVFRHLPQAIPLTRSVTTIGREADNDLCIPEAAVSRYHARVEMRSEGPVLVDVGSTNGTLVNGRRVREHLLAAHDVVRVGDTLFRYAHEAIYRYGSYRIDGTVAGAARPFSHGIQHPDLIGGQQIDAILNRIDKVARTELSVVVTGESGTGKELVARELHRSRGRKGPFQAINCAALPANLIESELFGYRRGAFTGASADKVGLLTAADGGTVFLDEIGDMPLEAQSKLRRGSQEREVVPIGATSAHPIDVRVVAATHRDLDAAVAEGRFRGDLLARLREFSIDLPPLRHRREDLYFLVLHFLHKAGRVDARVEFPFMLALAHYDFPYNVRELESAVKLALALAEDGVLDLPHLPPVMQRCLEDHGRPLDEESGTERRPTRLEPPTPATTHRVPALAPERRGRPTEGELRSSLERHHGNVAAVGREFGKERMQVHRWMRHHGIDPDDYRG